MIERKVLTSREFWANRTTMKKLYDNNEFNIVLQAVKKILDDEGIKFFLFFGTLVGAMREKDFILYDDDVDIGVFAEDINKIKECREKFKKVGYELNGDGPFNGIATFLYLSKENVRLDICPLFLFEGNRWFMRRHIANNFVGIPYNQKHFKVLDTMEFKGMIYNIPNNVEELLEVMWGNEPPYKAWWIATGGGQFGYIKTRHFKEQDFKAELLW